MRIKLITNDQQVVRGSNSLTGQSLNLFLNAASATPNCSHIGTG